MLAVATRYNYEHKSDSDVIAMAKRQQSNKHESKARRYDGEKTEKRKRRDSKFKKLFNSIRLNIFGWSIFCYNFKTKKF